MLIEPFESHKANEDAKDDTLKEYHNKDDNKTEDPENKEDPNGAIDSFKIILDFKNFSTKNSKENLKKLIMALKLVGILKDPETILNSELAIDSLEFIYTISYKSLKIDMIDLILENNYHVIIYDLLKYQYTNVLSSIEKAHTANEYIKHFYPNIKNLRYLLSTFVSPINQLNFVCNFKS